MTTHVQGNDPSKNKQAKSSQEEPQMADASQLTQELADTLEQLSETQAALAESKSRESRALSDYQNLLRRTRETSLKMQQLAAVAFVRELLEPLSHLELAKNQLGDSGLTMVVSSIWQALEKNGLQRVAAEGKEFDVTTMEVVQKGALAQKVVAVVQEGYTLNGEVIQHAKVVLD